MSNGNDKGYQASLGEKEKHLEEIKALWNGYRNTKMMTAGRVPPEWVLLWLFELAQRLVPLLLLEHEGKEKPKIILTGEPDALDVDSDSSSPSGSGS